MTVSPTVLRPQRPVFLLVSAQAASESSSEAYLFFSLAGRAATTSFAMQHANREHGTKTASAVDQHKETLTQTTRTSREEDRHGRPRYGSRAAQTSFYGAGGRQRQIGNQRDYYPTDDDFQFNPSTYGDTQYDDRWDPPTDRYLN